MSLKEEGGYTLVELLVVMVLFVIVIMVTANGFKSVVSQGGQQAKAIETDIGSIVGLEMFRSDLQNVGYGLPWSFEATPNGSYTEIVGADSGGAMGASFWPSGKSPLTYNDAGSLVSNGIPRAVQNDTTNFNKDSNGGGSQYLVIKSLTAVPGVTQKKFATVTYDIYGGRISTTTYGAADRDFAANSAERVFVVRDTFADGIPDRQLQVATVGGVSGVFSTTFSQYSTLTQPHSSGDMFHVYGVNPADATLTSLRMPFNRADYYVKRPAAMPPACAPNTGILYKAWASQKSQGGFTEIPLLDCVADMQVAYGWGDPTGTRVLTAVSTLAGLDAATIRNNVKEIRVYILAHEGKKDTSFTYPSSTINVGETYLGVTTGRTFDLSQLIGPGWQNYRWKLYSIVVRPKNLIQ